jgi:hypothetical protein
MMRRRKYANDHFYLEGFIMFKIIGHLVVFVVGVGAGVWWGVNNPTEAAKLAGGEQARIQQAVAIAKRDLLRAAPTSGPSSDWVQDQLQKAEKDVKNSGTNLLTPVANP